MAIAQNRHKNTTTAVFWATKPVEFTFFFLSTYVNGSWQIKLELRADAYRNMQVNLDFILKSKVCIYALWGAIVLIKNADKNSYMVNRSDFNMIYIRAGRFMF